MLAKDGAHIVVNDLDADPANQTVSDIMDMEEKQLLAMEALLMMTLQSDLLILL